MERKSKKTSKSDVAYCDGDMFVDSSPLCLLVWMPHIAVSRRGIAKRDENTDCDDSVSTNLSTWSPTAHTHFHRYTIDNVLRWQHFAVIVFVSHPVITPNIVGAPTQSWRVQPTKYTRAIAYMQRTRPDHCQRPQQSIYHLRAPHRAPSSGCWCGGIWSGNGPHGGHCCDSVNDALPRPNTVLRNNSARHRGWCLQT